MARSDDLAAAVIALIQTAAEGAPPTKLVQGFAPERSRIALAGRYVYVFALPPTTIGQLTRAEELREYKLAVVIVERYDGPATGAEDEAVPESWIQERKSWVETFVFGTLNPKTAKPLSMWPNRCEIVTDVDFANIQDKIFWSEVEVDYREIASN